MGGWNHLSSRTLNGEEETTIEGGSRKREEIGGGKEGAARMSLTLGP